MRSWIFKMKEVLLLFCTCSFIYLVNADDACDNVRPEHWSECKCYSKKDWSIKIKCDSYSHFLSLDLVGSKVDTLEIMDTMFVVMRDNVLINFPLKKLILRNIEAYFLSRPNSRGILSEVGETLQVLEIYNSGTVFSWKSYQFGNLKKLTHLVVVDSPTYYGDFGIPNLKSLEYLELRNIELISLKQGHFSELLNLRLLSLSRNRLERITRDMLPRPAEYLWHLDFSYNKLTKLEEDIFDDMKQLKEIRLDHNQLRTLPKDLFSAIGWQLTELWIHDNDLSCKKEPDWMKHHNLPAYTWIAECGGKIQKWKRFKDTI